MGGGHAPKALPPSTRYAWSGRVWIISPFPGIRSSDRPARSVSLYLTPLLTYYTEQSSSCEANRVSASQEIPRILWDTKVHYRINNYPPPVPILSQFDPVITLHPTSWKSIFILSSHLSLGLPNCLFLSGFPTKTLIHLYSPKYVPHVPPILVFRTMLGEE